MLEYHQNVDKFSDIGKRILAGVGLLLLFLMVMDFNNRMTELARLRSQRESEQVRLDVLLGTQSALETAIAYATSIPSVEEWAREEGRYIMPGDFPIAPLPVPGFTPEPEVQPAPQEEPISNWEAWFEWFLYQGP